MKMDHIPPDAYDSHPHSLIHQTSGGISWVSAYQQSGHASRPERLTPGHRRKCNKPLSCSIDHKPHLQQVLRGVDRPNNTEASSVSPWMTTGILQTIHPSFPRLPFPPVLSLLSHSLPHSCSSCHSQQAASNGLSMLHSPVGTFGTN